MDYVGVNIYFWSQPDQRRLLLDGLRPWALEARREGLARRFWYCRFDARGPHVFALFGVSADGRVLLREFLAVRIHDFLLRFPSQAAVDRGELERRHAECRGKALCAADLEEGLADNNSFVLFDHEADGYPLMLGSGMAAADEFWQLMGELTLWTLGQIERGTQHAAAIRWVANINRALVRFGLPAEDYWQLHATTLILPLAERLEGQREEVLRSLPAAVGERNRELFSKFWQEAESDGDLGFDVDRLVEIVTVADGRSVRRRFETLREVNHGALGQLEQSVLRHIPLVLYSWQRNLSPSQT